ASQEAVGLRYRVWIVAPVLCVTRTDGIDVGIEENRPFPLRRVADGDDVSKVIGAHLVVVQLSERPRSLPGDTGFVPRQARLGDECPAEVDKGAFLDRRCLFHMRLDILSSYRIDPCLSSILER